MAMMVYFAAGRLGSSRKMLLATIDTLAKPVTFLNVNVYGLCYKSDPSTVGLGDIASFDLATKRAALSQIWAVPGSFEPCRVKALDTR